MTCILIAHLGSEVVIATDKRVVSIFEDGTRIPSGDEEEKIVRTGVGVVTGSGAVAMLEPVKSALSEKDFASTDDVLELILKTRRNYVLANKSSPRLEADLAETSWVLTYPTVEGTRAVTRVVFYHQSVSADRLAIVGEGRVMCFPAGFTHEQAQALQSQLQEVTTAALASLPPEEARLAVEACMLRLMDDVSQVGVSVSAICDIAVVSGSAVKIALGVSLSDQPLQFTELVALPAPDHPDVDSLSVRCSPC